MKVRFLGATQTVTGSRYLVSHGKTQVLVDCGLFQGYKHLRLKNWDELDIDIEALAAVILTHAHLDHSGYLPLLVQRGFRGPIYSTLATSDLSKILLPDSGYLQEEEAKFANRHNYSKHHPALPLYTVSDAKNALRQFKSVEWRQEVSITKSGLGTLKFKFFPAGHLLGAASVRIQSDSTSILFSGDLGRDNSPLIRNPESPESADELVVESTYGNRGHPKEDPQQVIKRIILRTIARKGIVLIPSFAVGRAQQILFYLHRLKKAEEIPSTLPIYLNSPMAAQSNHAFSKNISELKIDSEELNQIFRGARVISTPEESKALNERAEPAVIIAASGMATGGRVLHHLKTLAPNSKNTILFVGFQAGGTRGDLMVRGAKEVKIHGQLWPIRAEVINLESLSAHADADEILRWISNLDRSPKRVFVTHGEVEASLTLKERIHKEIGLFAVVPEYGDTFEVGNYSKLP
ncbi:MAG: MBL fold metallo-hydrolase [Bdellovibrionales bacterium]|nr:MBL fold metallo-hydrolase [Bdellovibrionales bacterium]